jgi:hypothetical protein
MRLIVEKKSNMVSNMRATRKTIEMYVPVEIGWRLDPCTHCDARGYHAMYGRLRECGHRDVRYRECPMCHGAGYVRVTLWSEPPSRFEMCTGES